MAILDKLKKDKAQKDETKAKEAKAKQAETSGEQKVVAPKNVGTASVSALKVIVRPLITEKAAHMQSDRKYAFVVALGANKQQVKSAVKELYGVTPEKITIINVQGHVVRFGKGSGKRGDFKKAMVTLKKGDSITIHEGV